MLAAGIRGGERVLALVGSCCPGLDGDGCGWRVPPLAANVDAPTLAYTSSETPSGVPRYRRAVHGPAQPPCVAQQLPCVT